MGTFKLGSHLSYIFLTLGIRDLGYELDHAWEHTEAHQKVPMEFRGARSISVCFEHRSLANQFHNHCIICLSISGIGELIAL